MKYILTILVSFAIMMTPVAETKAQKVTDYETAVGLRLGWGFTLSGKHFINDAHAVEAIFNYRWTWSAYNQTRIAAIYQVHNPLDDIIDGLTWYWGVGGLIGFENYRRFSERSTELLVGVIGNVGLDFSFSDTPVNISVDLMPSFVIGSRPTETDVFGNRIRYGSSRGLNLDLGGVAVRYILQ